MFRPYMIMWHCLEDDAHFPSPSLPLNHHDCCWLLPNAGGGEDVKNEKFEGDKSSDILHDPSCV